MPALSGSAPRKRKARSIEPGSDVVQPAARKKQAVGKEPAEAADSDALRGEVAAFASSLGLAAASPAGGGFDDTDFRPEAAQRRLGGRPTLEAEHKAAAGPGGSAPARQRRAESNSAGKASVKLQATQRQGSAAAERGPAENGPAARKGRAWNEGAGLPPGKHQLHILAGLL